MQITNAASWRPVFSEGVAVCEGRQRTVTTWLTRKHRREPTAYDSSRWTRSSPPRAGGKLASTPTGRSRREITQRILDAGRLAGSARNRQPWRFLVVEDAGARERLAESVYESGNVRGAQLVLAI